MRSPWLTTKYTSLSAVRRLKLKVDGRPFTILLNPAYGSWMVLNQDESERYDFGFLTECEWENLYIRGLAASVETGVVTHDFPPPANLPSLIVVNVTTACNLACSYCFADCQPTTPELMSSEVIRATVSQTLTLPEIKAFTYEFQGGEPTLGTSVIREFIECVEKNRSGKAQIKYHIQSNGTNITDDFVNLATQYGIQVGISIDGPPHIHDAARAFPDGSGSFALIGDGIRKLRASGVPIEGSICNLGRHNVTHIAEILEFFELLEIPFSPRPLNILGRATDRSLHPRPGEWATAFKELHRRSRTSSVENFAIHIWEENTYTPVRDYVCLRFPCGAGREVISVNPNGDVYPCDGFKNEPAFKLGNICETTLLDMLAQPSLGTLKNRVASTIPKCSTCLFRGMCGSCCYSAFGAFGTIWREDPQCSDRRKIFLFLIAEWIRTNILKPKALTAD